MFSPSLAESSLRSSSSSVSAPTPRSSIASSTFFANARNSPVFETGSVSQATADDRPAGAVALDPVADLALGRGPAGALVGGGHPLLAQEPLGRVDVAAGVLKGALRVHDPGAGHVAELLDERGRDRGHVVTSSVTVSATGSSFCETCS